jgi:glycosyltransferase involved in cell wall biosynthesis
MKIVILSVWYSEKMGYIENCLPKSLAKLGHEVHVISSTAQVYYNDSNYKNIYEPYIGKSIQPEGVKEIDGFKLHRVSFGYFFKKMYLKDLNKKLNEIQPDIVQTFDVFSFLTLQSAYYKLFKGYKLFTANHTVASVFPLFLDKKNSNLYKLNFFFTRTIPGRIISWVTSRCYPATIDALDIAVKYYGIPKTKVQLACLGVDTDLFHPYCNEDEIKLRNKIRSELGFTENDIVCIYTGRYTEGKNPLCLAQAIEKLVDEGLPFKGFFMGNGPQVNEIKKMKGCILHEFVPYHELPKYYAIADIGVWPRQESTSMIDAAACGLPIIISNTVQAKERVDGNGLTYIENDIDDLSNTILKLLNKDTRIKLGIVGKTKTLDNFSWDKIAKGRILDYSNFIQK